MLRRTLLQGAAALVADASAVRTAVAGAQETPGVTATEIKIGNTVPYSGAASSYGVTGRVEAAFFKMLNEQGGIAGHKINFISLDDGYSPPKTVEQTRRLVEEEQVAFMFASIGTPTNTSVQKYLNQHKVPQLLILTGADKWGNYKQNPWTMGWLPSYRTEAQIYATHILKTKPNAKIGILYQNDDYGKDYVNGVRDGLGDKFDRMVVTSLTYEVTDPTVEPQIAVLAVVWSGHVLADRRSEVRGAGDPQGVRYRLEATAVFLEQRFGFGWHCHQAGGTREGHRPHHWQFRQGPNRSGLERRSRYGGMARFHGQAPAGWRLGRYLQCVGLRREQDADAGSRAVRRRLLARERDAAGCQP